MPSSEDFDPFAPETGSSKLVAMSGKRRRRAQRAEGERTSVSPASAEGARSELKANERQSVRQAPKARAVS
jgi:hypothetical protein